jgi:hypothetical protein
MEKFFKIESPDREPIIVFSRSSWVGLISIADKISEADSTMITQISLWQAIKIILWGE